MPTVDLFVLDLERLTLPDASLLPAVEQARHARFHHQADRDRFLAGRLLARAALARWLGCAPDAVVLRLSAAGRPEAVHPNAPPFSLAHSGRLVALAVGGARVGVDVEEAGRLRDPLALAPAVLTTCEREILLQAADAEARRHCFLRFWTLKEAYTKALGQGFLIDPRTLSFVLGDPPRLPQAAEGWSFRAFQPWPAYFLALAWQGGVPAPVPVDGLGLIADWGTAAIARSECS